MYDIDIDLTPTRRSFRIEGQVYSLLLERAWWETFDAVCPQGETRKGWIMEWIQDARDRGCNRQALIRYRIHQLSLEDIQDQGPDPRQELLERIGRLREKRYSWTRIANLLSEVELLPGGEWSGEDVKGFYYKATTHAV
mgnify:CR=1 FL=1